VVEVLQKLLANEDALEATHSGVSDRFRR
jgi:hypothetical protein